MLSSNKALSDQLAIIMDGRAALLVGGSVRAVTAVTYPASKFGAKIKAHRQ
jgi:hypothetical protein